MGWGLRNVTANKSMVSFGGSCSDIGCVIDAQICECTRSLNCTLQMSELYGM